MQHVSAVRTRGVPSYPVDADGRPFPRRLDDKWAIAMHIVRHAGRPVSLDYVADYFAGCHAELKLLPLADLRAGATEELDAASTPEEPVALIPMVVDAGAVADDARRLRAARALGLTEVWCYEIADPG